MKLNVLMIAGFLALGSSAFAASENYIVEPMICQGKLNLRPPGWASSYDQVSLKVTSFRSMRRDCTLVNSTATSTEYFEKGQQIVSSSAPEISGWFDVPAQKDGDTVTIPNGAWPGPVELKITADHANSLKHTQTLEGRQLMLQKDGQDYYYDIVCEANVVQVASIIENHTASCPNP